MGNAGGVFAVIIWPEGRPTGETGRLKSWIGQNIDRASFNRTQQSNGKSKTGSRSCQKSRF